jgi:hypothetical protein
MILQHGTRGRYLLQALCSSSNELTFTFNKSLAPWDTALPERLVGSQLGNNSRLLWNQHFYRPLYNGPLLVPILRLVNLV